MLLTSKTPFRPNLPWYHNGAILIEAKWFVVPPLNWVLNKEYFYHHPSYISSKLISYHPVCAKNYIEHCLENCEHPK